MSGPQPGTAPIVSLRGVRKRYGATTILDGIDLDVWAGELVCIMGPSGAGKTTLLRTINGLATIDGGTVTVDGTPVVCRDESAPDRDLIALRRKVGIVFQQFNLFPHKTALENVVMGQVHLLGRPRAEAEAQARALLAQLKLDHRLGNYPGELSAGQQQRIAFARTLALDPQILLLDEVTASLDPESVHLVRGMIESINRDGVTCIMVSHDMGWMRENARRVLFTDRGVIVESGMPKTFFSEARDQRTQSFLKAIAVA